jgi:hypothetical protein
MDESLLKQLLDKVNNMQSQLNQVMAENEVLKKDVDQVKSINDIGKDVAKELQDEIKMLQDKGISIKHLEQKAVKLKVRGKRGKHAKPLTKEEILDIQKVSVSAHECARKLGVSYITYKKYARLFGVHTLINFPLPKGKKPPGFLTNPYTGKFPLNDILSGKFPDFPPHRLKDKLIRSGKKETCCEQCGFKERRLTDGKIPLLLNFDDGNYKNHNIDNLKILCYNCSFVSGTAFIRKPKNTKFDTFDPDIMQGSKKMIPARH